MTYEELIAARDALTLGTDPWKSANEAVKAFLEAEGSPVAADAAGFKRVDSVALDLQKAFEKEKVPRFQQAVKAEANRRILELLPEWKQRNLTAQAAILLEKGRANWTSDEAQAWTDGEELWGQVNTIRAASNRIEALPPETDLSDDALWV